MNGPDQQLVSASAGQHSSSRYAGLVAVLAACAGLLFGLDVGVISGAEQFLQREFAINNAVLEQVVSSMMWGAAVGAALGGFLGKYLGRRSLLMLAAGLYIVGALFSAAAWSALALMVARVILGLGIGVAAFTAPVYIAEIAAKEKRGSLISTYQLMITIGILIAFLSDTGFSYIHGWRWMLGVIAFPGAVFMAGVLLLPESPRWLITHHREAEADQVMQKLRGGASDSVSAELQEIREQTKVPQQGLRLFRRNRNFRRASYFGVGMQIVQQLTGINVVMYYAPHIFADMGYSTEAQMFFTAGVGLINVLATFIAVAWIDRIGRKPILYGGFLAMAVGLAVFGWTLWMGLPGMGMHVLAIVMLLLFVSGFAASAGPLAYTLSSEVQPLKGRDFGMGASIFTNWLFTGLVGVTFLTMLNRLGSANTFWLYAALNAIFLLFTWALVPETKGVMLEEMEKKLMNGTRLRDIGA